LQLAVQATPPPIHHGRRIRLKFAHQGGKNPPRVVIHGTQVGAVPDSYKRYLSNAFRKAFKMEGTPVVIEFVQGENPYEGRKKVLTRRQHESAKRIRRIRKKKYGS
jgi:GTP-binding protein